MTSEQSLQTVGTQRNFGIDVIRGMAILLVVIHHLALPFRLPLAPSGLGAVLSRRWTNALSFNGYEAVFVFFVLSGFLIARRAMTQFGSLQAINWRLFYRQRVSRIVPLLLCLLAVLCVLHGLGVPEFVVHEHGQTLGRALFSALTLHLNWYEGQTSWLPASWDVLWSLSIEEVFYLAFPMMCLALPRRVFVLGLTVLALTLPLTRSALSGNEIWQEKAYLPGMSAIAFGVLSAMMTEKFAPSERFSFCLLCLGTIGLFGVFVCGAELWAVVKNGYMLLLCGSTSLCVLACHRLNFAPVRGLRWLAGMGRLSYEIYLSHMFVVLPVTAMFLHYFAGERFWNFAVYLPTIVACVLLAKMCERWVTKPAAHWISPHQNAQISLGKINATSAGQPHVPS
jgi:peptidoglycan/LPS O-acetylase OafA/YrhL